MRGLYWEGSRPFYIRNKVEGEGETKEEWMSRGYGETLNRLFIQEQSLVITLIV